MTFYLTHQEHTHTYTNIKPFNKAKLQGLKKIENTSKTTCRDDQKREIGNDFESKLQSGQ